MDTFNQIWIQSVRRTIEPQHWMSATPHEVHAYFHYCSTRTEFGIQMEKFNLKAPHQELQEIGCIEREESIGRSLRLGSLASRQETQSTEYFHPLEIIRRKKIPIDAIILDCLAMSFKRHRHQYIIDKNKKIK